MKKTTDYSIQKHPRITSLITVAGFLCSPLAHASWVWMDWGGAANNPMGTSGSFDLTPLFANYDSGNGSPLPYDPLSGTPNDVDGYGWDRTPEDFTFSWTTSGGEDIKIEQVGSDQGGYNWMEVCLDPDMNGTLPDSLSLTVSFPFDLSVRGIGGGGLGLNINPIDMTLDGSLSAFHADGTPVVFDNTYSFSDPGLSGVSPSSIVPSSYSGGQAVWNDFSTAGAWHGLNNSGTNASTYFPMVPTPSQSAALGQMTWELSDFQDGSKFRLSFDGGVGENAQPTAFSVPEPSSTALFGLGGLTLLLRRRR